MKYRSMETRNQEQQHVVRRPAFDTKAVNSWQTAQCFEECNELYQEQVCFKYTKTASKFILHQ
jgi:hypothetical protein